MGKSKLYKVKSIYVPKHERNFMDTLEAWLKEYHPDVTLSNFILDKLKDHINSLPKKERKQFEDCAWTLAQKQTPKTTDIINKFLKHGSI